MFSIEQFLAHLKDELLVWLAQRQWHRQRWTLSVKVSDLVNFPTKFSSDLFKICYMDSLDHTYQYVNVYKLIYFIFVCILGYFIKIQCFYLRRSLFLAHLKDELLVWLARRQWHRQRWTLSVKVSDLVNFPTKFASDLLKICFMDSLDHTYQYVNVYKLIYFIFVCILGYFIKIQCFYLRRSLGI